MKKFIFVIMAAFAAASAGAQTWMKTIEGLTSTSTPNYSSPILRSLDGGVVVTGRFDQDMMFGTTDIENSAVSSYVAKYDATGAEVWITPVTGSATINAITELPGGDLAVAGVFAGKMTVGGSEFMGVVADDWGELVPVSSQAASFVAVLGADGSVKAAKSYVPEMNSDLTSREGYMMFTEMYFSNPVFTIGSISAMGDKLVLSGLLKGELQLAGTALKGGVVVSDGWLLDDLSSAIVFTTDAALSSENIVATITPTEAVNSLQAQTSGLRTTVQNGQVYVAALATGKQTLTAGTATQNFDFQLEEGKDQECGFIVGTIAPTASVKAYSQVQDIIAPYELAGIAVGATGTIYVGGTFKGKNPFNADVEAEGESDLFIATIKGGAVSVKASNFTEGEGRSTYEVATCLFKGPKSDAVLYGYVSADRKTALGLSLTAEGCETGNAVVCGAADNAKAWYMADATEGYPQSIMASPVSDAVSAAKAGTQAAATAYDLQGRRTAAASHGLYIVDGAKVVK